MGKKSRLKKEKQGKEVTGMVQELVHKETTKFLKERGIDENSGSDLLYLVSMIVNFRIYRFIKSGIQLPVVKPKEEELDESRIQELHRELANICSEVGVNVQDVIDTLVVPLSENEKLVEQVLRKNYDLLGSLVDSDSFREMTDGQIENPETWGDNLAAYEDRQEDYFEAVKALFALDLAIVRSDLDPEESPPDLEGTLEQIRTEHGLEVDDVKKLRRRATEFLRVAFANYLDMDFQRVRRTLDTKLAGGGAPVQ